MNPKQEKNKKIIWDIFHVFFCPNIFTLFVNSRAVRQKGVAVLVTWNSELLFIPSKHIFFVLLKSSIEMWVLRRRSVFTNILRYFQIFRSVYLTRRSTFSRCFLKRKNWIAAIHQLCVVELEISIWFSITLFSWIQAFSLASFLMSFAIFVNLKKKDFLISEYMCQW